MSEYTPTTDEVRGRHNANAILDSRTWRMADAEFDRWLAAHDAEVRAGVVPQPIQPPPLPPVSPQEYPVGTVWMSGDGSAWEVGWDEQGKRHIWVPVKQEGTGHEGDS